jgi:hypothetical protein
VETSDGVFWAEAFALPFSAFMSNFLLRHDGEVPVTAGADFLLTVLVFDVISLIRRASIVHLVAPKYQDDVVGTFLFLLILGSPIWIATVRIVEPSIERSYDRTSHRYNNFPFWEYVISWTMVLIVTIANARIFLG